jgi:hypothetical protein
MLKFRKAQASKDDIRSALLSAVEELDSMD